MNIKAKLVVCCIAFSNGLFIHFDILRECGHRTVASILATRRGDGWGMACGRLGDGLGMTGGRLGGGYYRFAASFKGVTMLASSIGISSSLLFR